MAGDWIKMRVDLVDDPSVVWMAEQLGMPEPCVVGYLHTIWSWASRQCDAGSVTGVTLSALQRITHCERVAELMVKVGWLEVLEIDGMPVLRFPNWERHNSQSAKQRALTQSRVKRYRGKTCNAPVTPDASPEQEQEHALAPAHAHGPRTRTRTREDMDQKWGKGKTRKKAKRTSVNIEVIADRALGIFQSCRYRGDDGGNLWGVAALMETGIGDLSEDEVASACQGAALNGHDKAAHFFACLSETLEKRGENLTELLRRVVIVPEWPKTKLYHTDSAGDDR